MLVTMKVIVFLGVLLCSLVCVGGDCCMSHPDA